MSRWVMILVVCVTVWLSRAGSPPQSTQELLVVRRLVVEVLEVHSADGRTLARLGPNSKNGAGLVLHHLGSEKSTIELQALEFGASRLDMTTGDDESLRVSLGGNESGSRLALFGEGKTHNRVSLSAWGTEGTLTLAGEDDDGEFVHKLRLP